MKHVPRTQEQINTEIARLTHLTGKLRSSMWGDDNNAAVAAQISILKGTVDEAEIYNVGWSDYVADAAQCAADWMTGYDEKESLAEEWEPLIRASLRNTTDV